MNDYDIIADNNTIKNTLEFIQSIPHEDSRKLRSIILNTNRYDTEEEDD